MKSYSARPSDIKRSWFIIDASEASLGRICTVAASLLIGKHKPDFSHHLDCGDNVIIINAKNMKLTGNKTQSKLYYRHSGFAGGLKSRSLADMLADDPTKVVIHAIRGMLPDNKLRAARLHRLKVYVDSNHQHEAQKPQIWQLAKENK